MAKEKKYEDAFDLDFGEDEGEEVVGYKEFVEINVGDVIVGKFLGFEDNEHLKGKIPLIDIKGDLKYLPSNVNLVQTLTQCNVGDIVRIERLQDAKSKAGAKYFTYGVKRKKA